MKMIAVMAFLHTGLAKAGDSIGTNNMPEQIRNLMDSEGYAFDRKTFVVPDQYTNSLRNLHFITRGPFALLVVPVKKAGWSLWKNSSFKRVGSEYDQISILAPASALSQYEYDISYSFDF